MVASASANQRQAISKLQALGEWTQCVSGGVRWFEEASRSSSVGNEGEQRFAKQWQGFQTIGVRHLEARHLNLLAALCCAVVGQSLCCAKCQSWWSKPKLSVGRV